MRIAYLDCFAGIAGDMFLGALLDAGVPLEILNDAVQALNINISLQVERVIRSGICSSKVHVLEGSQLAEAIFPEQVNREVHTIQPKTQHLHKTGHSHSHNHNHDAHVHPTLPVRGLNEIRQLIQSASLANEVKKLAIRAFELLGAAEAKVHGLNIDEVHFHEVGAVDAIADIVGGCAGILHLNIDAWHCSAVNVGGGMVQCAHGTFPVPAPATADLLRNIPTYSAHIQKELVTPTGATLLRILSPVFGSQPPMKVSRIGYGAGTRNPDNFPNVLRLSVGELFTPTQRTVPGESNSDQVHTAENPSALQSVTVLETALDDLSPQILANVTELAFSKGALDVTLTPVLMKKGRPGSLLTILCMPEDTPRLQQLIFSETSTLGIRIRQDRRSCLERNHVAVNTAYGNIRMKIGSLDGVVLNVAPEFEDCRTAAAQHGVPLKRVQQIALAVYHATNQDKPSTQ